MAYETIIVDTADDVALITLNRPDALNALNSELLGELTKALTDADTSDKVRCIVITGSEKAFAAGADIKEMAEQTFVDMYRANFFGADDDVPFHGRGKAGADGFDLWQFGHEAPLRWHGRKAPR